MPAEAGDLANPRADGDGLDISDSPENPKVHGLRVLGFERKWSRASLRRSKSSDCTSGGLSRRNLGLVGPVVSELRHVA